MDFSRLQPTIFGGERVRKLVAVVVGAGALGNEVVKALGLLGAARVVIADPDLVEAGNLTSSILFRQAECEGCNKAVALARAAQTFFPGTVFESVPSEVADMGAALIASADLIFSCVDSDLARLEIAYLSTKLQIPVIDGALGGARYSHGRVSWFPGRAGACYGCKLPGQRRRELLMFWQASPLSCGAPLPDELVPSTPTMSAIIGSMQVELGIRNLLALTVTSESVELSLDRKPELRRFENVRAADCPFHERSEELLVRADPAETFASVLARHNTTRGWRDAWVHLDWPLCIEALCQRCSHRWNPMVRIAIFQRLTVCRSCGSRSILISKTVKSVRRTDAWSKCTLQRFGLPPDHLVSVRGFQPE